MARFNNLQLVEWCQMMLDIGAVYNYGTTTAKCSNELLAAKTKQYPAHYTQSRMPRYKKDIAEGKVCCDCIGLIKGFFWTDNNIEGVRGYAMKTGGDFVNKYASNGMPDVSAEGFYDWCKTHAPKKFSNDIESIPNIPGLAVFAKGHVGVYIGDGYVIEARGFAYGVVKTRLYSRNWTRWAFIPSALLDYISDGDEKPWVPTKTKLGDRVIKKGSEGDDVKELQSMLIRLGYNLGNAGADGVFGSKTLAAVRDFQKVHDLDADGVVGDLTIDALNKAMAKSDDAHDSDGSAKTESKLGARTLKKGHKGDDVKELQEGLMKLGYELLKYGADSDFGTETLNAVKAFQADKGLEIDGMFGPKSLAAFKLALKQIG